MFNMIQLKCSFCVRMFKCFCLENYATLNIFFHFVSGNHFGLSPINSALNSLYNFTFHYSWCEYDFLKYILTKTCTFSLFLNLLAELLQ